ncbi:hypothetical protein LSAT2_015182 [Lamellibrachia satsuma]|nr:hypothetical protein LSAT2_015182 [Lamellibrachia satsuma]
MDRIKENSDKMKAALRERGINMYQAVYPWLCADQFQLHVPGTYNDDKWTIEEQRMVDTIRTQMADTQIPQIEISTNYRSLDILNVHESNAPTQVPDIDAASAKLLSFIQRRDVHVVYHGPDMCSDKRPWSRYEHFHLTWVSHFRAGVDTVWNGVCALYKAVARHSTIPPTQTTKYPESWANYLAQEPRITWRVPKDPTMRQFAAWVFRPHVERPVELNQPGSSTSDATTTKANTKYEFTLPSGKTMNLYKYLKFLVTTYGHTCREDLVDGALRANDTSTFEKALTHPYFDSVCSKVFAVDQAMEQMQGFRQLYTNMNWSKFTESDKYLNVDASLRLFKHLLQHHDISFNAFVDDMWRLVTFAQPKTNMVFLHGVPNSGKSYVIRSLVAMYKYSATCQGTSSFPFMELVKASFALIEEPSFTNENLQTLKLLAEGTPTEVSVKNKGAAKITRIPIAITANYPFWQDGGAAEKAAFASRMFHYKFGQPAGFLKLAKKPLNPAMWRDLCRGVNCYFAMLLLHIVSASMQCSLWELVVLHC